jgi:Septum formation
VTVDRAEHARAYTSRHLAGWALALSLALCIPFLPLVGMGLGITVLIRTRRDAEGHGKGMAIAATVVGAVLGAISVAYLVIGLVSGFPGSGPDRDDEGRVTESGQIEPAKLQTGDCFNEPNLSDPGQSNMSEVVEILPCDQAHDAEVFHTFELDIAYFPTDDQLDRESRTCRAQFRDYVGGTYSGPQLVYTYFAPSERDWDYLGDRTMHCIVLDQLGDKLEESVEGSRQAT